MIKLVISFALVASAIAALPPFRQFPTRPPQYQYQTRPTPLPTYTPSVYTPQNLGRIIAILRFENDAAPDGSSYRYTYDTENGISAQETGNLVGSGPEAAIAATGSYQYTSPEGVPVQVSYVADENGFQPAGNVLPTPPPIPEAIQRSLAYNAAHPEPTSYTPGRPVYYQK